VQSIARAGIVPTDSESAADRQSNPHQWWRSYWRRVKVLASQRWQPILVFSAAMFVFNALRIQSVIPVDDPLFSVAAYTLADMPGMPLLIFTALVLSEALGLQGVRHALASFGALLLFISLFLAIVLWISGGVNRPLVESKIIVSDAAYIGRLIWFELASGMLLATYFAIREREAGQRSSGAGGADRARADRARDDGCAPQGDASARRAATVVRRSGRSARLVQACSLRCRRIAR
jgi:hypothetical protein